MRMVGKTTVVGLAALAVMAFSAVPAMGVGVVYREIVPWSKINEPPTNPAGLLSTHHYGWVINSPGDTTGYFQLGVGDDSRITKVTNITGPLAGMVATELLPQADWAAASGVTSMTTFYGFGAVPGENVLQFSDTSTDQVWRVDKDRTPSQPGDPPSTAGISAYATQADIIAATGGTAVQLLTPNEVWGTEHVFYEGSTDQICITNGPNNVTVLVTATQLQNAQGNTSVSGGLGPEWGTAAGAGDLYWGNTTSDDVWKYDGVAVTQVLSAADILAVTGKTSVGFKDMFPAPDGMVYFYEMTRDAILRFDPASPAPTLEQYITEAKLIAGPGGSDNVYELGWYHEWDTLAFNLDGGGYGFYAVLPEPTSVALLALAGLTLLRRRR